MGATYEGSTTPNLLLEARVHAKKTKRVCAALMCHVVTRVPAVLPPYARPVTFAPATVVTLIVPR